MRRVVTGQRPDGISNIASDAELSPINVSGVTLFRVWGFESLPTTLPVDGLHDPVVGAAGPAPGGVTISTTIFAPNEAIGANDAPNAQIEFDADGFHRTDSVEVAMVSQGEVSLRLDDGSETILRAGDWVVQNGTEHAWGNAGTTDAVMVWVTVRAERTVA